MSAPGTTGARALTRTDRRRWRRLRMRAALGLLPGAASELAAHQQRLLSRIAIALLVPVATVLLAVAALLAWQVAGARGDRLIAVRTQRVLAPNTWQPARLPYSVRGDDGYVYSFAFPPRLRPGDVFYARYDGRNRYLGTVANGRFSRARSYRSPLVPLVVILAGVLLLTLLLGSLFVAARRRYQALVADRRTEPVAAEGVYEGSWVPRSLALRVPLARALALPVGFPVVIRDGVSGKRLWLTAPLERLPEVKAFEEAIAAGSRVVDVRYRPRTGVIESLAAAEGGRVNLQRVQDDTTTATFTGIVFAP